MQTVQATSLRLKLFRGSAIAKVEADVNQWLTENNLVRIHNTQLSGDDVGYQINIAIWYE